MLQKARHRHHIARSTMFKIQSSKFPVKLFHNNGTGKSQNDSLKLKMSHKISYGNFVNKLVVSP